jgi:hypothetical protein
VAIDDLNARAEDAAKGAGESLSRLAKPLYDVWHSLLSMRYRPSR